MMNTHTYLLCLAEPGMLDQMSSENETTMDEYFARLQQSLHDGRLLLAGPCEDKTFGIVIFRVQSIDDAQRFMSDDPAVRSGLMSTKLHPFRISLVANDALITEDAPE